MNAEDSTTSPVKATGGKHAEGDGLLSPTGLRIISAIVLLLLIVSLVLTSIRSQFASSDLPRREAIVLGVALAVFAVQLIWQLGFAPREDIVSKTKEVQSAVAGLVLKDLTTMQNAKAAMRVAVAREELSRARAGSRSDALYRAGFSFMLLSVAAPVACGAYYWNMDPLPASVVRRLAELHRALGMLPAGTTIPVQRDWRVIVGGISFGFLFLAAAAGLMKQHGRQASIQAQLGRRVSYFQRIELVVALRAGLGSPGPEQDRDVIDLVSRALLAPDEITGAEPDDKDGNVPPLAGTAADVLKLIPSR